MTTAQLEPLATQLLANLFAVLEKPVSEENEYVMKGLFQTQRSYQKFYFYFFSSHHEEFFDITR